MGYVYSIFLVALVATSCAAQDKDKPKTVGEGVELAAKLSQLTLPRSKPFHLKATIAELDSPDSDYKAEVEMYWAAQDRWRRTIKSPDLSQTMVVNGDTVSEQNQGGYFPWWLNDFVIAMFQLAPPEIRQLKTPLPDLEAMQKEFAKKLPPGLRGLRMDTGRQCVRGEESAGIPPVHNTIFTSVCFENPSGLVQSVIAPHFSAEFGDFRAFKGKNVARKITLEPEPGTKIEARITELSELENVDPALFAVQAAPAPQDRIVRIRLSEGAARDALLAKPEIAWLPVRDGKTSGTLSLFVSIDRQGHVRETWPLNSDNPFPEDQARKEVALWRFKPFVIDGAPAQVETILTFAFQTKIGSPIALLSDADARKLALETIEPQFPGANRPPAGKEFTVVVAVDESGRVIGLNNPNHVETELFLAANAALHKWRFRPYTHDGKPDRFDANITFRVR